MGQAQSKLQKTSARNSCTPPCNEYTEAISK